MINLVKDIKPISYVKAHTADVLKQIEEKNNPVVITQNGKIK
ncbi:MAG: type II toxin-antitoxin system Phd/YefM family antitoxin [Spirochaetaceae bacterium]|nr:type II toxin-antitoxin system Phd/YefM family antitoxin [Spirochaetaceae bacterium]